MVDAAAAAVPRAVARGAARRYMLVGECPRMRELYCLIAILLAVAQGTFIIARGAPPPLARAAALEDSLSSRGPQAPQTPPQATAPTQGTPAVFRTSTRLVEVSVVVHDSRGQPVSDLKKEDFTITERGKPQQVVFFSMASADRPAAPSAPLPPHIFSNVFTGRCGCADQRHRGASRSPEHVVDRSGVRAQGAHQVSRADPASGSHCHLRAGEPQPDACCTITRPMPRRSSSV